MAFNLENLFEVLKAAPTFMVGVTLFFLILLILPWSKRHLVQQKVVTREQWKWEIRGFLTSIVIDVLLFFSFMHFFEIRFDPYQSFFSNVVVFVVTLVWFDFWFYVTHRIYHLPLFYPIHRQHHRSVVTTAITAHSFSIVERAMINLGIMLPVVVWNLFEPMPFQGFVCYQLGLMVLNAYGHSNIEFLPLSVSKNWFFKNFTTPTAHSIHHLTQKYNFCLVFKGWDRLFGTYKDDSEISKYSN